MTNGWYSPMLERKAHELSKWPPPKKYTHEDWLAWTQAPLLARGLCLLRDDGPFGVARLDPGKRLGGWQGRSLPRLS